MTHRHPVRRPSQGELFLPLLSVLEQHPEGLSAAEAAEAVADKIGMPRERLEERAPLPNGGSTPAFARDLRWARQKAKLAGLIDGSVRNLWKIPPKGPKDLRMALPGLVITVFETEAGVALYGLAESVVGLVEDRSVQTILTSPPYPLTREKAYGNKSGAEYLDWMAGLCREFHRVLNDDGSLLLNLGDTWNRNSPTMSLYQERLALRLCDDLGFHFAQRLVWHSPSKLPAPAEYVTVQRIRLNPSIETIWWLSKSERPKADNRRCLRPYSKSMVKLLERGGMKAQARPSGHAMRDGAFGQNHGGSIAHALLEASHTASNDPYQRRCREASLPIHPARMPRSIAETLIPLTTEPDDLVADFFGGSLVVGHVAETLGRRFITSDASLTYLQGGALRWDTINLAA